MGLFETCKNLIEKEYSSNVLLEEANYGVRFLYSSKSTMNKRNFEENNRIMLVGLNPGGGREVVPKFNYSFERGNAYIDERWGRNRLEKNILQKQIEKLLERSGINPYKTFSCNFIPFRSPNFNMLPDKKRCIDFSKDMWENHILKVLNPKIVLCIGNGSPSPYSFFSQLPQFRDFGEEELDFDWGNIRIKLKQNEGALIVGLPHLSRFSFIGKDKYENSFDNLISIIKNKKI